MTSLPTTFSIGSASSNYNVRDAIASYRRAQYFATSNIEIEGPERTSSPHDGVLDQFSRGDIERQPSKANGPLPPHIHSYIFPSKTSSPRGSGERTPLLRKAVSFSEAVHPRLIPGAAEILSGQDSGQTYQTIGHINSPLIRPNSFRTAKKVARHSYGGKSTYSQTLFNSIAILLGIGMLSEPLAFAYAGWTGGTILIIFYGFITCYTAKILAHIILDDPRLCSYADIGRKAFGPKSTFITSSLFCLELFALSVILVTLYADSLHAVAPSYSANTYKLWGLLILIPTVFLPLSLLSYASIIGVVSTILIIVVLFVDGFSKRESPGSLWAPAETHFSPGGIGELGIAFGLFMGGFSGHTVIPSLVRDMVDPSQFDDMINWAFIVTTFIYTTIGYAGYLMFGQSVSDEVSTDLLNTPGIDPYLNKVALWMLVISPLSKFALCTRPLNITLEIMLGLESSPLPASPEDHTLKLIPTWTNPQEVPHLVLKRILTVAERIVFAFLSVGVSILVPEFSVVMAFLGSFSAFMLCVIGPISAKSAMLGRWGVWDIILLVIATVMAAWGTIAAFWST